MRTNRIEIRVNEEELQKIKKDASERKMMLARFIRTSVLSGTPPTIPQANLDLIYQLKKIGNNLNQIAREINFDKKNFNLESLKKEISALSIFLIEAKK